MIVTKLLYFSNHQVEDLTENLRHAALVSASAAELEVSSCVAQLTDPSQLDSCLAQLREVLGPLVPEETLVQVATSTVYCPPIGQYCAKSTVYCPTIGQYCALITVYCPPIGQYCALIGQHCSRLR